MEYPSASIQAMQPLARAFGGAILFAMPMLMTMEMWWLGLYMDRLRLCLFLVLAFPLLVGLSYHAGFEKTFRLRDDVTDAFVAYAVGFVASGLTLFAFGVLTGDDSPGELLGKISIQAVPASMGAILARSQLGIEKAEEREKGRNARYAGEIFLMGAGALFFSFNVAPTEEVMLITYKIDETRVLAIMAASLTIMHAFTYTLGFRGQADPAEGTRAVKFFFFTVVGYAVSFGISWYVLWTFGRLDGAPLVQQVTAAAVLGLPASIGAAAARLIL
jgi:putative integral membrane protein (TIGR02587 family)